MADTDQGVPQDDRLRRAEPERTAPKRDQYANPEASPPPKHAAAPETEVGKIVADVVRIGYDVIGENLRQGRAAADLYSRGGYRPEQAASDLGKLGDRLVQLTRDLSTTVFDLAGAIVRDPVLREALQPREPRPVDPPPQTGPVALCVEFGGDGKARAETTLLQQPEKPTTLLLPALHPLVGAAPPITGISFRPAADGNGIAAQVAIAANQPAGKYTGAILDAGTHQPLGALTIEVLP